MVFWVEARQHPVRALKTLCLLSGYMALGLASGLVGPTLLDLRQQVQTGLSTISYVLTSRAGGHAIGSVISELIFNTLYTHWYTHVQQ